MTIFRKNKAKLTLTDEQRKSLEAAIAFLQNDPQIVCDPYPQYPGVIYGALHMFETDVDYMANHARIEKKAESRMSAEDIRTMFTFIARGERFCDGHIMSYVEDGTLLKLLERVKELAGEEGGRA